MGKLTLKERLLQKKKELKDRSSNKKSNLIFIKEGTLRVRVKPTGEDEDFAIEVITFFLGKGHVGFISPSTFNEPCAVMEAYDRLKASKDEDNKLLAKKLSPKTKYLIPVVVYKDEKGKEVDEENSEGKFVQITSGMYNDIIDFFLDEDDWGDFTDVENGYDLKLTRSGSGKMDTEYSVTPCKNTPTPKKYRKVIDLEEEVRKLLPTYEETEDAINGYLNTSPDDDESSDDESREKRKSRNKDKKKSKKSSNDDM
jgi:hypothetical protein